MQGVARLAFNVDRNGRVHHARIVAQLRLQPARPRHYAVDRAGAAAAASAAGAAWRYSRHRGADPIQFALTKFARLDLGHTAMKRVTDDEAVSQERANPNLLGLVILIFAVVYFGGFAHARAEPKTVRIVGLGAVGCAEFSREVHEKPSIQRDYLAWAQGFMSGILASRPKGVDDHLELDPPKFPLLKQLGFLRAYCTQNPSMGVSDGVVALYKRLRREQN